MTKQSLDTNDKDKKHEYWADHVQANILKLA